MKDEQRPTDWNSFESKMTAMKPSMKEEARMKGLAYAHEAVKEARKQHRRRTFLKRIFIPIPAVVVLLFMIAPITIWSPGDEEGPSGNEQEEEEIHMNPEEDEAE
ncbi:hypothetical protein JCM19037_2980 [Geomicrobium sp. JCM 19037]|uniref:hypothetical protein n=1 Tax=Geomicrobium sp. JCM 19037 TaxID=1460634 RepID=UPI00045F2FB4|nr:hypothetical protein [Geomicrobium sp. JCM 19037]GAK04554.1 hypothetical protein JCM19037_2980 [Geomicrobium sp. JCM 19037]